MRMLIKSGSESRSIITGADCLELVEAMRLMAPFAGCADAESYMRWALRRVPGAGEIEGETPEARAGSFLARLGELGLVEFLSDKAGEKFNP